MANNPFSRVAGSVRTAIARPSLHRATLTTRGRGPELILLLLELTSRRNMEQGGRLHSILHPLSHLKREKSFEASCDRHGYRVPHRSGFGRQGRGEARSDPAALSFCIRGLLHRLAISEPRLCRSKQDHEKHDYVVW